jgi:hypothetical protein
MQIILPSKSSEVVSKAGAILAREMQRKIGISITVKDHEYNNTGDIILATSPELASESFSVSVTADGTVRVSGGEGVGVLYGCGWLLHHANYAGDKVQFVASEGIQAPKCSIRGVYFATHCYNWYHCAPLDEIRTYIEELALWGVNSSIVWFDMNYYTSIDDPQAQADLARINAMQQMARAVGMHTGIFVVANESYNPSLAALRADFTNVLAPWGNELCPSNPAGRKLLLDQFAVEFAHFDHLDFLGIWPYDPGGCSCEKCRPWGCNGFISIAKDIADLFHCRFPQGKIILSTWCFDLPENGVTGEWDGLFTKLEDDLTWPDYILADGHQEFPQPVLARAMPRHIPIVNFPEISMKDMAPWGGYGANPLPAHWQKIWDSCGDRLTGGFPYSEGFFEDINKVIWAQLYWNGSRKVTDIMREYATYEFSRADADEIVHDLELMERIHPRGYDTQNRPDQVQLLNDFAEADEIWESIAAIDARLPQAVRESWRWRIIYLRALIDKELKANGGKPTPTLSTAFDEISDRYYADEQSFMNLRPIKFEEAKP